MATELIDPKTDRGDLNDRGQLEIVAEVPLTKEQTEKIKADIGVEVSTLIVQHVSRARARAEHPGYVSLLRLTWCW